jgi:hypothetical protein
LAISLFWIDEVLGLIIEKRMGLTQANKIYVQPLEGENEKDFHPK